MARTPIDVIATAAVVLGGCWTTQPPVATPPVASDDSYASPRFEPHHSEPRRESSTLPPRSVWRGTYICTQGLTAVTLRLEIRPNGEALAIYEFGPLAQNPSVPEGSFEMTGTVTPQGPNSFSGDLQPGAWLKHPANYVAVGLTLEATGNEMAGSIASPNCRDFRVRRVD